MRHADHAIDPLFLERHSPRAMSGAPLPKEELLRLFEAARWAPSSSNVQPWRFAYALRDTPAWSRFFGLLVEGNQVWCQRASALIAVCGKSTRTAKDGSERPARLYAFDCGAAWMSMALQGTRMGLVVHAMEGFDYEKSKQELHCPEGIDVLAMVAVGLPGNVDDLPADKRPGEQPNQRDPIEKHVVEGGF